MLPFIQIVMQMNMCAKMYPFQKLGLKKNIIIVLLQITFETFKYVVYEAMEVQWL